MLALNPLAAAVAAHQDGRFDEALCLLAALLDGLPDGALRDLAARELAHWGRIMRTIIDRQMALDAKATDQSLLLS